MRSRSRQKGRPTQGRRTFGGQKRLDKKERVGAKSESLPKREGGREGCVVIGELRLHRDGYGFVVPTDASGSDVFIPPPCVGDALHTDLVEVRAVPGRRGKLEGRITRIIERRVWRLMGRLERVGGIFQVLADDRRISRATVVASDKLFGAGRGDNVVVKIVRHPQNDEPMHGEVIQILGERGDESTEKSAVIARQQLCREFPHQVLKEADAAFRLMDESVIRRRIDLRDLPFVTVDGENAKDFDDAIAVETQEGGVIRLWVSIADVSWFVRPQTALDRVAYERGTSVYFPGDCLPMLPEQLSNDLCSLKPNIDRLTFTAEMDIDHQGEIIRSDFYRSVIQSRERMTYTAVKQLLVDRDSSVRDRYRKLVAQFELMEECHRRLRTKRIRRGSIDFDLPEPEIVIDLQGEVSEIVRAKRHVGHMMIEDFMIAANEAVASFLTARKSGCIYRVHEPPPADKLQEFALLLHNLGHAFRLGSKVWPGELAKVVQAFRGQPEERLINHQLLRAMSQAVYSTANAGHFGLASKSYCHFTSPIRRYPDLVVHRLLGETLAKSQKAESRENPAARFTVHRLQEISEHSSRRERIAMEAEREMAKLYATMFIQAKIGEEFDGIISHVTKFGFFVELIDFFIEGFVHINDLPNDKYRFEEKGMFIVGRRRKNLFRIGDKLHVIVRAVDIPKREINFELI